MRKSQNHFAVLIVGMFLLAGAILVIWKFQPWMPTNTSVQIGTWVCGDHEFQVWQRKDSLTEPFAIGLFVQTREGKWVLYCLSPDDLYRPKIKFRTENGEITVTLNTKEIGVFDSKTEILSRRSDGVVFESTLVDGTPPGVWWDQKLNSTRQP